MNETTEKVKVLTSDQIAEAAEQRLTVIIELRDGLSILLKHLPTMTYEETMSLYTHLRGIEVDLASLMLTVGHRCDEFSWWRGKI